MIRSRVISALLIMTASATCIYVPPLNYTSTRTLGILKAPSGTLMIVDPFYLPDDESLGVKVRGVAPGDHPIIGLVRTSFGDSRVMKATITLSDKPHDRFKLLGKAAVDSGTLSVVDRENYQRYFVATGKERDGYLVGRDHRGFAEKLNRQFGLKYRTDAEHQTRIEYPVSRSMQKKIENYLEINGGSRFQLIIVTGNTCDRIMEQMEKTYQHSYSVVNHVMNTISGANIIVFSSGYGDGEYDVYGYYAGNRLVKIEIDMDYTIETPK